MLSCFPSLWGISYFIVFLQLVDSEKQMMSIWFLGSSEFCFVLFCFVLFCLWSLLISLCLLYLMFYYNVCTCTLSLPLFEDTLWGLWNKGLSSLFDLGNFNSYHSFKYFLISIYPINKTILLHISAEQRLDKVMVAWNMLTNIFSKTSINEDETAMNWEGHKACWDLCSSELEFCCKLSCGWI